MGGRLPNFAYIGPSKAGSTWLHEVLIRHPQVFMSPAKDIYFFDRYFDRGLEWYASHFQEAGTTHRVVGEVCQEYLSSPDAPERMRDCLGADLKLMLTVRDPVDRAFSCFLYMRKHGVFSGSFREALESRPGLLDHARYATLASRFLAHFPRSAIHCAVFDDLVVGPQTFIDRVSLWLRLDPMVLDESLIAARLPASRARYLPLARVVKIGANWARDHRATSVIGRVKRSSLVQTTLYRPLVTDRPVLLQDDVRYIRERMYPEITEVERTFGLDLIERWGWDNR